MAGERARTAQATTAGHLGFALSGGREQSFYRYEGKSGRVVIVDSLDKVPQELRGKAERVQLSGPPSRALGELAAGTSDGSGFHLGSFALGVGAASLCIVVALLFRRAGSLMLAKLLGGAALLALLGGLYLGMLRHTTGQSDSLWSSPGDIVDDARKAVEKTNASRREQQKMLDEIQHAK